MNPVFAQALAGVVELFLLVFIRMTGMFVVSPVFGRQNLPVYYKVGFSFFIALIVFTSAPITARAPVRQRLRRKTAVPCRVRATTSPIHRL